MKNTTVFPMDAGREHGRRAGLRPLEGLPVRLPTRQAMSLVGVECCWLRVWYRSWAVEWIEQPVHQKLQLKMFPVIGISRTPAGIPYKALALFYFMINFLAMLSSFQDLSSLTGD